MVDTTKNSGELVDEGKEDGAKRAFVSCGRCVLLRNALVLLDLKNESELFGGFCLW